MKKLPLGIQKINEIIENNYLFNDLFICDKIEWQKHPVLHIDFSRIAHDTPAALEKSIHNFLDNRACEEATSFRN